MDDGSFLDRASDAPTDPRADVMPAITASRGAVYRVAHEVRALATIAMECTVMGGAVDVPRAQAVLAKARALIGEGRA